MFFLKRANKDKVLLLAEGKKKIGEVKNAMYFFDKKFNREVAKGIKKTIKQEETMKKINLGNAIMIFLTLVGMIGGYISFTKTQEEGIRDQAKAFQKMESGLTNIDKNQSRLMKLTEKIADNQTLLRVEVAKVKTETNINSEFRKDSTTVYKRKRRR